MGNAVDPPDAESEIRKELADFEGKILQRLAEFESSRLKQEQRAARREFWVALATIVIAIATVVYVIMTGLQWSELQNANARTDNLIQLGINNLRFANKAASDSRTDTNRALKAVEGQASAMTNSIGPAATDAAKAAKISAANSDRIAKSTARSIDAAQASAQLDQRARVVVQGGKGGKYLSTGPATEAYAGIIQPSEVHIDLVFSNNGKTLAADVQLCAAIIYVADGGKQPPTFSLHRGFDDDCVSMASALTGVAMVNDELVTRGVSMVQRHRVGPMHPGEPIQYTLLWRGVKSGEPWLIVGRLGSPEIDAIERLQAFFVITARLLYRDDFGKSHDTLYCARWQPPSDQLLKLPYGNDEN